MAILGLLLETLRKQTFPSLLLTAEAVQGLLSPQRARTETKPRRQRRGMERDYGRVQALLDSKFPRVLWGYVDTWADKFHASSANYNWASCFMKHKEP